MFSKSLWLILTISLSLCVRSSSDLSPVSKVILGLIVTGGTDIVLKVRVPDVECLNDLIIKQLRKIEGVDKTQTMMVLEEMWESITIITLLLDNYLETDSIS